METKEYKFIDKTTWPEGPWKDEPDKVQWEDHATGLPCIAKRNEFGAWCGYVGVTDNHDYFHMGFDDDLGLDVHGGLTYADVCQSGDPEHGICHIPGPGEPDLVWWFGFDCAHSQDFVPGMGIPFGQYRDLEYVKQQCTKLAQQLAAV